MTNPARPSPVELQAELKALPLFAELEEPLLARLARSARWSALAAGNTLFDEGTPAAGLYVLHSGWVKLVRLSAAGREQVLAFVGPGESFNEIGAFANHPNPATGIAMEPVGFWLIGRSALADLLAQEPAFARHVVARLAQRVLYLAALVGDLSLRTVRQRLAAFLLHQAAADALARPAWYTQNELGARLGTVPDVIQRTLRQFVADGLITVERQQITIHDSVALQQIADS